jgi:hypothetical protein
MPITRTSSIRTCSITPTSNRNHRFRCLLFLPGRRFFRNEGNRLPSHHLRTYTGRRTNAGAFESAYDLHLRIWLRHRQPRTRPHDVGSRQRRNRKRPATLASQSRLYVSPRLHSAAARHSIQNSLVPLLLYRHCTPCYRSCAEFSPTKSSPPNKSAAPCSTP